MRHHYGRIQALDCSHHHHYHHSIIPSLGLYTINRVGNRMEQGSHLRKALASMVGDVTVRYGGSWRCLALSYRLLLHSVVECRCVVALRELRW